jgi:hypothetical protein
VYCHPAIIAGHIYRNRKSGNIYIATDELSEYDANTILIRVTDGVPWDYQTTFGYGVGALYEWDDVTDKFILTEIEK